MQVSSFTAGHVTAVHPSFCRCHRSETSLRRLGERSGSRRATKRCKSPQFHLDLQCTDALATLNTPTGSQGLFEPAQCKGGTEHFGKDTALRITTPQLSIAQSENMPRFKRKLGLIHPSKHF